MLDACVTCVNRYKYSAVAVAGLLTTISLPPMNFIVCSFVAFPLLYFCIIKSENWRHAFFLGWLYSMCYLSTSLSWFINALMLDLHTLWWVIPLALFALPSLLSICIGLVAMIVRITRITDSLGVVAFAMLFTAGEWVLGHLIFTGFPWNMVAQTWSNVPQVMQIVSVVGVYGLVFLTVLCTTTSILFLNRKILPFVTTSVLLIGIFIWGAMRLNDAQISYHPDIKLRIVQPNTIQKRFINERDASDTLRDYVTLTHSVGIENITHVIWAESAILYSLNLDRDIKDLRTIGRMVQKNLISGFSRLNRNGGNNASMLVIDRNGTLIDFYDKHHLVPFGEVIPFVNFLRRVFPSIEQAISGNVSAAENMNIFLDIPGTPKVRPMICYEIIFPLTGNRQDTDWILNITNDSWFGVSLEPAQHLAMAMTRAIEEGVPVIRATKGGISAVIDGYGRLLQTLPTGVKGVIDTELPKKIPTQTIYAKYVSSEYTPYLYGVLCFLIVLYGVLYKRKSVRYVCHGINKYSQVISRETSY